MSSTQEFRLCVITDLHIGHPCKPEDFRIGELSDLVNKPNVSKALSNLITGERVDSLISCGDLIHDPNDPAALDQLHDFLVECTANNKANVCAVLGNHDLWERKNSKSGKDLVQMWRHFRDSAGGSGSSSAIAVDRPVIHRVGDELCDIFLLDNGWSAESPAWKEDDPPFGRLSDSSLRWLDKELAASKAIWAIVVSHFPLHYFVNDMQVGQKQISDLAEQRRRLHAVLENHPRAVIHLAGHTHEGRITHGQGAIEITTPAFNESRHFCRILTVRPDALSIETRCFDEKTKSFDKVRNVSWGPNVLGFQLGQQNDIVLSVEPDVKASPSYIDRLSAEEVRRLVREGFEKDRDRLREGVNRTTKNESAWEGYVGHSLQQMNESRKAFVEDINRYVLLYSVMLGAIFILANQAIQQPDRWLAVFEMFMAVGLTLYTMRILGLMRQKARASYSYYVASSFHAFVVHAAFCDSEPHTWMKHARNYLESVRKEDLKNLRDAGENSASWIRQAWAVLCGLFGGKPTAGICQWNDDAIRHNWQRIAEERWTKTSSHKNANNLFQSFDRAAKFSGWMLAGLCLIGLTMCGVKVFGVWDWSAKDDDAPPPASIQSPVPTPSVPALHDNGPMRPADDAREEGASAESAAHGAPVPEGSHAEAGG